MAGIYPFEYVDTNLGRVIKRTQGNGINRYFKKSDKVLSGITKTLHKLGLLKNELQQFNTGGCYANKKCTKCKKQGKGYQIGFGLKRKYKK